MTLDRSERLAEQIVDEAYAHMVDGALEPADKIVILLARSHSENTVVIHKLEKLIRKVSQSNGHPLTITDRVKAAMSTVAASGAVVAIVIGVLTLWERVS